MDETIDNLHRIILNEKGLLRKGVLIQAIPLEDPVFIEICEPRWNTNYMEEQLKNLRIEFENAVVKNKRKGATDFSYVRKEVEKEQRTFVIDPTNHYNLYVVQYWREID